MMEKLLKEYRFYLISIICIVLLVIMKAYKIFTWNEAILAFTAIVISWYTVETRILAQHSKKQIEIETRPIIIVRWEGAALKVRNIGRSPAFNVSIRDINFKDANLKFGRIDVCEVDKESGIAMELFIKGFPIVASGEVDSWIRAYFILSNHETDDIYKICIDYYDTEKDMWQSEYLVTKKGVNL